MAETEYHIPFPRTATETKQSRSKDPDIIEEEAPTDWEMIDRLLILMSLAIAERTLRKAKRTNMDSDIRVRVLDRLRTLIEEYKQPRSEE